MSEAFYIVAIAALLPLTACMLVLQVNPYHALVIRGILGAIAALVYALLGAADVALTEALVGTMLSITLYAVAVRSSLSMRLGMLESEPNQDSEDKTFAIAESELRQPSEQLLLALQKVLKQYHMRLELVPYSSFQALQTALMAKEVHAAYAPPDQEYRSQSAQPNSAEQPLPYLQTRVQRLYDLLQSQLPLTLARLNYVPTGSSLPAANLSDSEPVSMKGE